MSDAITRVEKTKRQPSLLSKLKVHQRAVRVWQPCLPGREFQLAVTLVDMTHAWGREYVDASHKELATRCNTSVGTIKRAQIGLARRGVVEVLSTGRGIRYVVNIDWDPSMQPFDRVPKRLREVDQIDPPDGSPATPSLSKSSDLSHHEDSTVKKTNNQEARQRARPPAPDTVEEVVDRAQKTSARRTTQDRTKVTHGALWRTWERAMGDAGFIPLTWIKGSTGSVRGQACAARLGKSWTPGDAPGLHDFLIWVVENWSRVMSSPEFSWMDVHPKAPRIEFVSTHRDTLTDMWRGGISDAWRDGPDAKRIAKLIRQGRRGEAEKLMEAASG